MQLGVFTMKIQKGQFIEVSYTAQTQEGMIFDSTDEAIAKKSGIYSEKKSYGPQIVCVGEYQVITGLDNALLDKEESEEFSVTIEPQDAYGKKKAELLKLVPAKKFKEQGVQVAPGMQVYIDNQIAQVKTVSSGRAYVDFNHPLAGKTVTYDVKVGKVIEDVKTQFESLITMQFRDADCSLEGTDATVAIPQEMPKEVGEIIEKQIKKLIPKITSVTFKKK
jgi:FKBP-type peptidyl-prolyl cis-trans isomerase 2